jgi:hypothetical protein
MFHVRIVAILFIAFGVFLLLGAAASFVLIGALQGASSDSASAWNWQTSPALPYAGVFALQSIPCFLCGWGLLRRRQWSRTVGMILAAVALVEIPIGTAFGIYALIVLFKTEAAFAQSPRA